jgi:hypothetical protein
MKLIAVILSTAIIFARAKAMTSQTVQDKIMNRK